MEERKFRNHYSVVFENLVGFLVIIFFIGIQNIKELAELLDSINDLQESISNGSLDSLLSALIGFIVIFLVFALVIIIQSVIWSRTWITITDTAIIMERNTIMHSKNTIGIKNLSNVNTEQNLFEKIIGTCKVKLDTNSLSTANETDIKIVLRKKDAIALRSQLLTYINQMQNPGEIHASSTQQNSKITATTATTTVPPNSTPSLPQNEYDIVATASDIFMHGLCSINISTIMILIGCITGVAAAFTEFRDSFSGGTVGILSQLIVIIFIIGSCIKSLFGGFITYYGFRVARKGDKLHVHYGLLRTQDFTIPVSKISSVIIHQTFISRLMKRYMLEVVNVGMGDQENEAGSYIILACNRKQLQEHLNLLLPEFSQTRMNEIQPQPKAVWKNKLVKICIWSLVVILPSVALAIALPDIHWWMSLIADLALIGCSITLCWLDYITAGTCFSAQALVTATGYFGRNITILPYENIQYVKLNTNTLLQHWGLTRGSVYLLAAAAHQVKLIPCCNSTYMNEQLQKNYH